MDLGGQDTSTDGDLQKTAMNSMKRILVEKQVLYVHVCVLYSVCTVLFIKKTERRRVVDRRSTPGRSTVSQRLVIGQSAVGQRSVNGQSPGRVNVNTYVIIIK